MIHKVTPSTTFIHIVLLLRLGNTRMHSLTTENMQGPRHSQGKMPNHTDLFFLATGDE